MAHIITLGTKRWWLRSSIVLAMLVLVFILVYGAWGLTLYAATYGSSIAGQRGVISEESLEGLRTEVRGSLLKIVILQSVGFAVVLAVTSRASIGPVFGLARNAMKKVVVAIAIYTGINIIALSFILLPQLSELSPGR